MNKASTFAVFILTHGRADTMSSYDVIRDCGYTGEIYLIVDNTDEQIDKYVAKYGDNVIVFNKDEAYAMTDSMENNHEMRSVVYARNYSNIIAEKLGLKYYAQFDDDVTGLFFKYIGDNGKLKSKAIHNLDAVFDSIVGFLDETDAVSCGLIDTGALVGGASGPYKKGLAWNFNQTVVIRTGALWFVGFGNQDVNAVMLNAPRGKMLFELCCVAHSVVSKRKPGGLTALYADSLYAKTFLSVVCAPGMCYMTDKCKLVINRKNAIPKIIGERWRK